jgi:zinc protease
MYTKKLIYIWFVFLFGVAFCGRLVATPQIESWMTHQGVKVFFVHAPEIPMVDIRMVFDAGSARDGTQPGITSFTNSLLEEGAGQWDAYQIAERLERVGAQLEVGSRRDMAWISLRSLTEKKALNTALETLAVVVAKPRFDQKDVTRIRQSIVASLLEDEQSPASIGMKQLYRQVFGDHPYANYPLGTKASVTSITREDILKTHQRLYVARNALVAIVGDIKRKQAEKLADRITQDLPIGEVAPPLPAVKHLDKQTNKQISFPSKQAHLYLGQPGMKRTDPDYFPLYIGNHILGGSGLVSILSDEVREKRGLSYSVYSYFIPMRQTGMFLMGLQTKNSQAEEALDVIKDVLTRYLEQGPTEQELQAAKQNITGGFPLRIDSNRKIAEYLAIIGFYKLSLDYLDTFVDKVASVTQEEIRDTLRRRLDPKRMVFVQVGHAESQAQKEKQETNK